MNSAELEELATKLRRSAKYLRRPEFGASGWARDIEIAAAELAKPRLPWRKVSEEPDRSRVIAIWISMLTDNYIYTGRWGSGYNYIRNWPAGATHWCYLDELRPEDAE